MGQEEGSQINEKIASIWENLSFYKHNPRERSEIQQENTFYNFTERTLTCTQYF